MQLHKEFGFRLPAATKLSVWEKLNGQKLGSLPLYPSPKNMSFQIALVSHSSPFSILCLCRPAPGVVGFLHTVYTQQPMCSTIRQWRSMCRIPYFKGAPEWIITAQVFREAKICDKISHLIFKLNLTFTYLLSNTQINWVILHMYCCYLLRKPELYQASP